MAFNLTPNVEVERDGSGAVHHLNHPGEPYVSQTPTESQAALAIRYLRDVAELYRFPTNLLAPLAAEEVSGPGPFLEFAEQKSIMGTTTVSFVETYERLPIWEAGFTVLVQSNPSRVTGSWSTVHREVDLDEPASRRAGLGLDQITPGRVSEFLGLKPSKTARQTKARPTRQPGALRVNGTRELIYRYDPELRTDPESRIESDRPLSGGAPTLDLPSVPESLRPGRHYRVIEVLFTLPLPNWGEINWRCFLERYSGVVLYLRAFVACANGFIYPTDPMTAAGGPLPGGSVAALNALRILTGLSDLPVQVGGTPVGLSGRFVQLVDFSPPAAAAPTESLGHFLYAVDTTDFSAVNAYNNLDVLFRLMESTGIVVADYFDDTSFNPGFPLPVDHWGAGGAVNAFGLGNTTGTGSGGFIFGRAAAAVNVGIADDARVVAHEFCHALLWDSVHSPNFGFAHSAGDSIGAILNDPGSQAPDRFETFPWIPLIGRRQDRGVGAGWAWGGVNDTGGYNSEQILCTSHFRAYRSTGGDASTLAGQRYAARWFVYLIIRGIGSLGTSPITPTPNPNVWVTTLTNADIGTTVLDDQPGGGYTKVIRWAFERQGLFQPAGTPLPITTPGAPPPVDVYIDDGRAGQYDYHERFWENTEVWNRRKPDGHTTHQTPVVGKRNYAYARVHNRGTQVAGGVVVRGHHCRPSTGLVWPDDWTAMTTQFTVPGTIAPGGQVMAGPLEWTPSVPGHEIMLVSVGAPGDLANIDPATSFPCATGPTPIWRLVPFDNNLAQRSVIPVPGGGGKHNLVKAFEHRRFWVANPFPHAARIDVQVTLPALLTGSGWQLTWDGIGAGSFTVGPRDEEELCPRLVPGGDFTANDVRLAGHVAIDVVEFVDGLVVGGLSFVLDPDMTRPARELLEDGEGDDDDHDDD